MESNELKYVFGPVPSRRLGRSLGVDLVPFKTCSYDCTYCQLGKTTRKTVERRDYVPTHEVLRQVEARFAAGLVADYVTLSGSGEPSLHAGCGEIIRGIKKITDTPVAVLTNGSLLWDPDVRQEMMAADLVVPSLDAGDNWMFKRVNRPHHDIVFETMVEGLIAFRRMFPGQVWLEVLLVGGQTGNPQEVENIAGHARRIGPDRVQINTVVRPPAEEFAGPVPPAELTALARLFGDTAEVIADYESGDEGVERAPRREDVLGLLERRPCTLDDVSASLGIHRNEVVKHLDALLGRQAIKTERTAGKLYYVVTKHGNQIRESESNPRKLSDDLVE